MLRNDKSVTLVSRRSRDCTFCIARLVWLKKPMRAKSPTSQVSMASVVVKGVCQCNEKKMAEGAVEYD